MSARGPGGLGKRSVGPSGSMGSTVKYKKYSVTDDPNAGVKKMPSQVIKELEEPPNKLEGWRPTPKIVEFLNMGDYTHQTNTIVDIGEPIFQPFPPEVQFTKFQAFKTYECLLHLRNNDNVPRRVKVQPPNSPYFKVAAVKRQDGNSKVASGMEVAYIVTFQPEDVGDYQCDIIVATEREKFVVPIIARGARAALDFPDLVQFPPTPAKTTSTKTVLVRNVGLAEARFMMVVDGPFTVSPSTGALGVGETMQCTMSFTPPSGDQYNGELCIQYGSGDAVFATVQGPGCEVDVCLSTESIQLPPTFISKVSQKVFKIVNRSDTLVHFSLKKHGSAAEEGAAREALQSLLMDQEMSELGAMSEDTLSSDSGDDDLDDIDADEDHALGSPRTTLARKFRRLRRANDVDELLFQGNDTFTVSPVEGAIYPGGEQEITVRFHPKGPHEKAATVWVDVGGRSQRLPLFLGGLGKGPQAIFSYDVLDVGDTLINSVHQYEVELHNRGEIECVYRLEPPQGAFGSKFTFEPSSGVLEVGDVQTIQVMLASDLLGEFNQSFDWSVTGASEKLALEFKGRVVGPTFRVDAEALDFGVVSYSFRYTQEFTITNTSVIPMPFSLGVLEDKEGDQAEFSIVPDTGTIVPHGQQTVQVEFISRTLQQYDYHLAMAIPGVGDAVHRVPVTAECCVPRVELPVDFLDFGTCFLRHEYEQTLRLRNDSKLPAKFEVMPQDEQSKGLAVYTAEPQSGGIPARGEVEVTFRLSTARLGRIQLPVKVKVVGSQYEPLELVIAALATGPNLHFGREPDKPEPGWAPEIDFGRAEVLAEHSRTIYVTNASLVPAEFKCFVNGKDSSFSVDIREGTLQPQETIPITIGVLMDETMQFHDSLNILVMEGDDTQIPIKALGTGSTVVCEEFAGSRVDFGNQFTGRGFSREFVLNNLGRKSQTIVWTNPKLADKARKAKAGAVRGSTPAEPSPEDEVVYTMTPERAVLASGQAQVFTLSGISTRVGLVGEELTCSSTNGKVQKEIFKLQVEADVAQPLLEFSEPTVNFLYSYEPDVFTAPMKHPLTIRNVSKLPLTFQLKATMPFSVDRPDWTLEPTEKTTVWVFFDPGWKHDRQSMDVKSKLAVTYSDNPQKDSIDLAGEINFPNVELDTMRMDFGCVLNDTTQRKHLKITNVSKVPAEYKWIFFEDETVNDELRESLSSRKGRGQMKPPANQVFDILPIRGCLLPGESEWVELSYYAQPGIKMLSSCVCEVRGGPDYEVGATAESSSIKYTVEPHSIDVGLQLYDMTMERKIMVHNTSKVPFDYRVNLGTLSRKGVVTVAPMSGRLEPLAREFLRVRVTPGIPDRVVEKFLVEVAHFEPEEITVLGEGVYPTIAISLPREPREDFPAFLESAKTALTSGGPRIPLAPPKGGPKGPKTSRPGTQTSAPRTGGGRGATGAKDAPPPGAGAISEYKPQGAEVEIEADRLVLIKLLLEELAGLEQQVLASTAAPAAEGGALALTAPPPAKRGRKAPKPDVVVAQYTCDFGHVVKGTHRVRKFRLSNMGIQLVSYHVDKSLLAQHGFTMEPDNVSKLPGYPDFESVEVSVTFNTARPDIGVGPLACMLPLKPKNGPTCMVALKANVVVPELSMSRELLDFEEVQTGHVKIITVELHNPTPVVTEWRVQRPMEGAKDWGYFTVRPNQGILQPDQKMHLQVEFQPVPDRAESYSQKIPLKVLHNNKLFSLQAKGSGHTLSTKFDAPAVDLGAILPTAEGPNEAWVRLINPCKYPIEVFSCDFDKQYMEDEEVLRHAEGFDERGVLRKPPLAAGEPMYPDLVERDLQRKELERVEREAKEEARRKAEEEAAAAEAAAAAEGEEGKGGSPTPDADAKEAGGEGEAAPEGEAAEGEEVGELEDIAEPEEPDTTTNVLLLGPPLAGKTSQAAMLAERYGIRLVSVDAAVAAVLALAAPEGEELAEELAALLEEVKAVLEPAEAPKEGEPAPQLPAEVLGKVLAGVVGVEAALEGVLFDGVASQYAAPDTVAEAVALALGMAKGDSADPLPEGEEPEAPPEPAKGKKGAPPPEEEEDAEPKFLWEGRKKLHVMHLKLTAKQVCEREDTIAEAAARAEAEAAATAAAEAGEGAAEEATGEGAEGAPEEATAPAEGEAEAAAPAEGDDAAAAPAEGEAAEEAAAPLEGEAAAEGEEEAAEEPPAVPKDEAVAQELEAYLAAIEGVMVVWGAHEKERSVVRVREVEADGDFDAVRAGVISTLPRLPTDPIPIPPPYTLALLKMPAPRPQRKPVLHFSLHTPVLKPPPGEEPEEEEDPKDAKKDPKAKKGSPEPPKEEEGEEEEPKEPSFLDDFVEGEYESKSRWVLAPESEQYILVRFQSPDVGRFDEMLAFEVAWAGASTTLLATGTCAYPQISTDFRNVFYRKVKNRPASANVSRQFVVSRNQFEFGPLLAAKDKEGHLEGAHPDNMGKLRISNNGMFDLKVTFAMRTAVEEGGKDMGVFILDPPEMDLKVDEVQDLSVYAFPPEIGLVEDAVVCQISDNPTPVSFDVTCVGAKPTVEVDVEEIKFERLIVGHKDEKVFTIRNTCLLPFKWKLMGVEDLEKEFTVSVSEGELAARTELPITVTFDALEKNVFEKKLSLEITDVGELQGVAQTVEIPLSAEAYKIEVDVKFPEPEKDFSGLDFGVVKVVDPALKVINLCNNGKYPVGFAFNVKTLATRELFTISPSEGTIQPDGKDMAVEIHFNKDQLLRKEVTLKDNKEITIAILEPQTDKKEDVISVKVDLRAVFCKYALLPRGVNFGPLVYNTTSNPRTFEIQNTGEFPFTYDLSQYMGGEEGGDEAADPKAADPKGGKGGAAGTLALGNFTITPSTNVIEPGASQTVTVEFKAENQRTYVELIGIDITDRDFADAPGGIQYEIAGESCIPGILCDDVSSVFEEHKIVNNLDPLSAECNVFAKRDKVFSFGPVIAQMGGDEEGQVGAKANLKISNPNKVACTVNFSLKPRGAEDAKEPVEFPMDVQPSKIDIPPHEHRYVTVYFTPRAIERYTALFEATVENGGDPRTKCFSCDVVGEGTLPHLTLEQPSKFTETGSPWLSFPRLLHGKSTSLPILLKNNGNIPASARIDMEGHPAFRLVGGSANVTLGSKKAATFMVDYHPEEVGSSEHSIRLVVKSNQFESQTIHVSGECYLEDVTFNGLPNGYDDELHFDDGPVGSVREVAFSLQNHCDQHLRFEWPEAENFTFEPRAGHLHVGASKDVVIKFHPEAACDYKALELALALQGITYAEGAAPQDWDTRMVTVRYEEAAEEEAAPAKPEKGAKGKAPSPAPAAPSPAPAAEGEEGAEVPKMRKVVEVQPEPEHEEVKEHSKSVALKVFAVADNARYECEAKPITFRPTMMFQSRTYNFPLKNASTANLDYSWKSLLPDGSEDPTGLYEIKPAEGSIPPGQTVVLTVRFSPMEVVDCRRTLVCDIPDLEAGYEQIRLPLNGKATRPWCHFELPESDYVSSGRRNPELMGPGGVPGPIEPSTKVLEFESLGTKVRNTKRFHILNPTSVSYEFQWEPLDPPEVASVSPFRCVNRRGVIMAGKKYEMVFEYTPDQEDIAESFLLFKIPEQGISVPFLLVGNVIEPSVTLDRANINFDKVLVGARGREILYLVNNEHIPFNFSFDKGTYEASDLRVATMGRRPVVELSPASGTLGPNSRMPVTATFAPMLERTINYNVVCQIKKKPSRLTLNVKGEGYAIHESILVDTAQGDVELAPNSPNNLDFGQVLINERSIKQLSLINSGSINYDFAWDTGPNPRISVKPEAGTVAKGERFTCEVCYNPHVAESLEHYKVTCQVINGNKYTVFLNGVGHRPKLNFSFQHHDFGPCFIVQPGMPPNRAMLRVTNNDEKDVSFDVLFENKEHIEVEATPTVLHPGQSQQIPITFLPRDSVSYEEVIRFEVNGLYTINVAVRGEGTPLRVELVDVRQQALNFGSLSQGMDVTKHVKVANRSKVATAISLAPSMSALSRYGVTVIPAGEVMLRAKETATFDFTFRPVGRTRPFSEDVLVDMVGVQKSLLVASGACLGTEVKLASDSLPFGAVVQGSQVVKRLQLENTGDVGTKFTWDTPALGPHFSIFPSEGYLAPNQDVKLDVTFHPGELNPDIRVEKIACVINGGETQLVTLTGSCVAQEPDASEQAFECNVRKTVSSTISVKNETSVAWNLKPVINNDYWEGNEFLNVPAKGSAEYTLHYTPLTMSSKEEPHQGSVFFPLPDGTGLLYKLVGTANPPLPEGSVTKEVPAKHAHTELLTVANWLGKPQRFKAVVEVSKGELSTQLKGQEYIDVPAHSEREFKLHLYSYKEGPTEATVTFKNEVSGEFLVYDLSLTATAPAVQRRINLQCPVRQRVNEAIVIENPLDQDLVLTTKCDHKQVSVGEQVELKAKSSTEIPVGFRPLLAEEATAVLSMQCEELGVYEYELHLRGTPAGPERGLTFTVPLGSKETHALRFMHYLNDKADYECAFVNKDAGSFECNPSAVGHPAGPEGIELEVEVTFEPTHVGENYRDTLVVKSGLAGEYVCPVSGRCIPPKPRGPFDLKGGSGAIAFKNVFTREVEYTFTVDNPQFDVKRTEMVAPKKETSVSISFKDAGGPKTGKLIITCADSPFPWVYYLRAI